MTKLADAFAAHPSCRWPPTNAGPGTGKVFCVGLDQADLESCHGMLSDEEMSRAQRFATTTLRRRYIAAHLALRAILGDAIGCEPHALRFAADLRGKPCIADPVEGVPWRFSLSHSGPVALIAIALGVEVGVDVEQIVPLTDVERLIGFALTLEEQTALPTRAEDRLLGFYSIWTAKEAALKALGIGLGLAPNLFAACDGAFVPLDHTMPYASALGALAFSTSEPCAGAIAALASRSVEAFEFVRWPR